jgi:hypothetical protein
MKEIFTHPSIAQVGLCKSLLEEAGIACFIRNEAAGMITAVPIPVFYPVLCVVNDADSDRAKAMVDSIRSPSTPTGSAWVCPHCQSAVPAGFDVCWNCERERPAAAS